MPFLLLIPFMVLAAVIGLGLTLHGAARFRRALPGGVRPEAGFLETLRSVPLSLVVGLDLLDLGLEIFAAPIDFLVLSPLKLTALRRVAMIEAVLPFTAPIPTLTICWFVARLTSPATGRVPAAPSIAPETVGTGIGRKRVRNTAELVA